MGIHMDTDCLLCHLRRNVETAKKLGTEEQATAFAKELMKLYLAAPEDDSSPTFVPKTAKLFQEFYGLDPDRFRKEKEESNRFVLERVDSVYSRVRAAGDPVKAGLQFAILGNYIDFSALQGQVSFRQLDEMLDEALDMEIPEDSYRHLISDLEKGKKLLYLTDNAGEICFDRIFAEEIHRAWPELAITFCVRGGPSQNDATREDAALAGIPFPIIDNGNLVAGTDLKQLSREADTAIREADVIISKGQGNVETLYGCGYNIYYAFLIKCERFRKLFGAEKFTPMLVRERTLRM